MSAQVVSEDEYAKAVIESNLKVKFNKVNFSIDSYITHGSQVGVCIGWLGGPTIRSVKKIIEELNYVHFKLSEFILRREPTPVTFGGFVTVKGGK